MKLEAKIPFLVLEPRQKKLVELMARGGSTGDKKLAAEMGITLLTVRNMTAEIYRKMRGMGFIRTCNKNELLRLAFDWNGEDGVKGF